MTRYGMTIGLRPEKREEYLELHRRVWPEVLAQIEKRNIRNYSIYLFEDRLFSYFEYVGTNFEADMAQMAADPITQEWWALTEPCQLPDENRPAGTWWTRLPEVFHND